MLGIGVDIEETHRFRSIRYFERFLDFIFTAHEKEIALEQPHFYSYVASRFAAKEAVIKAVPQKLSYRDFEVLKNGNKPVVHFLYPTVPSMRVQVSLSHSPHHVIGFAISE